MSLMSHSKQTTKAEFRANCRVSLIGFVRMSNTAIHVRVPDATYLLSHSAWSILMLRRRAWGTELNRALVESEGCACSVRGMNERVMIIIDDLAEGRTFCIREEDLARIQPGQQIPVYGRDSGMWKYPTLTFRAIENVLSPIPAMV